ncbi:MAG: methionine synthase [Candidatus Omnitrophota bacterium]
MKRANIEYFSPITIRLPKDGILSRLGYQSAKTRLKAEQKIQTERFIEEAASFIAVQGAARRVSVQLEDDGLVRLADGTIFQSRQLSLFLNGCGEILLMGATAGKEIIQMIEQESKADNLTRGVVFDAVASEMVDSALGWIMDYFNRQLRRESLSLTKNRFSAGYGDFLLQNQKKMFSLLDLKRLGITLTKAYVLIPEKSVTAIAGIRKG